MKKVKGDLLKLAQEGQFDVIVHGCNCFCLMGAGIAKTIKSRFPQAYKVDCATATGDKNKLGTITNATVVSSSAAGKNAFTIVNGYTQFHWNGEGVLVDYKAIENVFRTVKEQFVGKRIGYPMIGAGLARGDWNIISAIIDKELVGEDHTVVEYEPPATAVRKRARPNNNDDRTKTILHELVAWIRSRGGFVHKAILLSSARDLQVTENIPKGTLLMKLPQKSVVINRRFLPSDYQSIFLDDDDDEEPDTNMEVQPEHLEDIILALYLANNPKEVRPYLNSLPDASSAFSTLPSRWSLERQTKLLSGSPVLKAARNEKKVLERDYNLVINALSRLKKTAAAGDHHVQIPPINMFCNAMAYVESRAFGLDGMVDEQGVSIPAMIPLLDLCDHRRGNKNGERKNVSYMFQEGNVLVKTVRELHVGETLRITYGARSNTHLLLKYGFCLAENVEPDGSSNDVLDFQPISGHEGKSVKLQTGPKSYTFGKFVKALECFYPGHHDKESSEEERRQITNDLEAFLDECDQGKEIHLHEDLEEGTDGQIVAEDSEDVTGEIEALSKFKSRLLEVAQGYGMSANDISKTLSVPASTPKFYAALLIHSELRVIRFFLLAIQGIKNKIEKASNSESFDSIVDLDPDDLKMVEEHVHDLVDAYIHIRHPSL